MLNNESFFKLLPPLVTTFLLDVKILNLTANTIDDDAIAELMDNLKSIHN